MKISYEVLVSGINRKPPAGSFGYASVVLIKSGKETILFDTGSYGLRGFLKERLKTTRITAVVLSHLHYDHCSNIDMFPGIPLYISRRELDFFESSTSEDDPDIYRPFKVMRGNALLKVFDGNAEIANSVKLIQTPGHTPGHCSLEVLTDLCPVLIAGDAIKSSLDWSRDQDAGNAYLPDIFRSTKKWIKSKYETVVSGHEGELRQGVAVTPLRLTMF